MTTGSGWDGILAPGEKILWQGQPEPGIVWADALTSMMPGGAIFTVFATFWIVVSSGFTSGGDVSFPFSLFPLAGLPFLGVGLYMLGGHVVYDAYLRSVTWYTLTDRTAFIATAAFGWRRLESLAIRDMAVLRLEDGTPGSVIFARRAPRKGRISTRRGGFRRIADARGVYGQMRGLHDDQRHTETA
jgi:hypothetical protein